METETHPNVNPFTVYIKLVGYIHVVAKVRIFVCEVGGFSSGV